MSLLNCVGCKKQNVHSQTWTKFLRFFRVFMYFRNKFSQKETSKYWLNVLDLSGVLILKIYIYFLYFWAMLFKDTYRGKTPSNKTLVLTKSTNMGILVIGTSNQPFIRGS